MLLCIDDNKTTGDIQEKFSECFPALRLKFFSHADGWNEDSGHKESIDSSRTIGAIRKKHDPSIIEITSQCKAGKLEKEFKQTLGLAIHIYYKENNTWVQTIHNDKRSLAQLSQLSQKS